MAAPVEDLLIEAGRADRHYVRDLWRYRELLGFLAWRDIKVRYKQTAMGVLWVVIQPTVQTILLTFVFSKLARMPSGSLPYVAVVLAGQIAWMLFSSAFIGAGNSLTSNTHLVGKVYFPRLILPLSALGVALVDCLVLLALTLPFAPLAGIGPTWRWAFLPLFMAAALAPAIGAGLWIGALTVKYRDFRFITPFLLQIGMFVTPVGFSTQFLPSWRELLALNPLTGVVEGFRWCLLGEQQELFLPSLVSSGVISAILIVSGLWYFRRTERQFADIL
ncbi:MAG TPA: ABC transporter permease [Opitutaceae bacterium]|jgi:lipopolysaccharide transport system permease protein|nr:ABC transporter permease [Opitutaceae bacterium]